MGTASTSSGSSIVASVVPATFQLDESAKEASAKPSTWLPESPMKTIAFPPGRRFSGRKPRQAAPSASESTSTARFGCSVAASTAKYAQAMVASDAASPSMLSSRLKAFAIPTSQTSATTVASTSLPITSTRRPLAMTMPAAPNCAPSFASGLRWRTSSISPAAKRSVQPPTIPQSSPRPWTAPIATATTVAAAKPAKMPTPPKMGVARSCQRSPDGTATNRAPTEELRSARSTRYEMGRATIAMAALTTWEG